MKTLYFIILATSIISNNIYAQNKIIKACSDNRGEYPNMSFVKGKTFGVWVDIMNEALSRIKNGPDKYDFSMNITGMPITKCQSELIKGTYDVILTASYNPRRSNFFYFPPNTENEKKPCSSPYKFVCTGYVVISPNKIDNKENKYIFKGNIEDLPDLVFIDKGRSIIGDLEEKGIVPEISDKNEININRMLKEGGVTIMSVHDGITLTQNPKFSDKVTLQKIPFAIKSYYVPFSKMTKFTEKERMQFWKYIAIVSNDKKFLRKLYRKYK